MTIMILYFLKGLLYMLNVYTVKILAKIAFQRRLQNISNSIKMIVYI